MENTSLPLTLSQERALSVLTGLASIQFKGTRIAGLRPRTNALLVGPSGAGKTHVVTVFADRLGLPVLKLTVGDWIVNGARASEPCTMERVQSFVGTGRRGVIFIDELDKMRAHDNQWSLSLVTEVYGLLDRRVGLAGSARSPWTAEHSANLRDNILFVGAGTWMDLWTGSSPGRSTRPIGFCRTDAPTEIPPRENVLREIRAAHVIAEELLFRFCPDWLVLDPYSADDFRMLGRSLGLGPELLDPAEGAASGLNFRFIEACLTRAALAADMAARPTGAQLPLWQSAP